MACIFISVSAPQSLFPKQVLFYFINKCCESGHTERSSFLYIWRSWEFWESSACWSMEKPDLVGLLYCSMECDWGRGWDGDRREKMGTSSWKRWKRWVCCKYEWPPVCNSVGEGNDNPLQYSCLENPVDSGAWWAAVYGVAQSRTRLKQLSMHACMHWRRKWQPTPVFLPGESQGRGSLVGCRLWGRTESDTTEAT